MLTLAREFVIMKFMAMESMRIIHSDEKRHKCHDCGSVRYESYMEKLDPYDTHTCWQWGNALKCWICRDCKFKRSKTTH